MTRLISIAIVGLAFSSSASESASPVKVAPLAALSALQPGQWVLKARDGSGAIKTLCLGDPRILLQMRHPGVRCSQYVVENDAQRVVVHYSCPGAGNGRTVVRLETPRLVQIDSQGIAGNTPFDVVYEGRRIGDCAVGGPAAALR